MWGTLVGWLDPQRKGELGIKCCLWAATSIELVVPIKLQRRGIREARTTAGCHGATRDVSAGNHATAVACITKTC